MLAFVVAPPTAPVALWLYLLTSDLLFGARPDVVEYVVTLPFVVALGAPASYAAAALAGLPAYLLLSRFARVRAWHMVVVGAAAGMAVAPFALDRNLAFSPIPAGMGATAASVWWMIYRTSPRRRRTPTA
ncbi:MAG: hypothetical protein OER21_12320 [Gemmatimonadota bacterium]|nr:hypothetical protein [Gemmatimonadota bacterium]